GIDHAKSAAIYVSRLLGLKKQVRAVETKQACYGTTAAIQLAKGYIALNPESKVLILASDIARYGLATPGEVTQGSGAVAVLLRQDPRVMTLEKETTFQTEDSMDFWRPIYSDVAFVDGNIQMIAILISLLIYGESIKKKRSGILQILQRYVSIYLIHVWE